MREPLIDDEDPVACFDCGKYPEDCWCNLDDGWGWDDEGVDDEASTPTGDPQ